MHAQCGRLSEGSMYDVLLGAERRMRGGEMLPMLVVGLRGSPLRGEEAGRFREVAGMSIVAAGAGSASAVDT